MTQVKEITEVKCSQKQVDDIDDWQEVSTSCDYIVVGRGLNDNMTSEGTKLNIIHISSLPYYKTIFLLANSRALINIFFNL